MDNPESFNPDDAVFADGDQAEAPLTIEDAARETPDDPEPADTPYLKAKTTLRVTAGIRKDVEGKLAFALGLSAQVWTLADPVCGMVYMNQTPDIAKRLTPIVCQSPDVVKWLTKSSNFILYVNLFMSLWPVLQMVFAHHIARTYVPDFGDSPPVNEYVVQ